jgi:sugar lactone lactonase YvrE
MLPLPAVRPLSVLRFLQSARSAGLLLASGVAFCSLARADTAPTAHFVSGASVLPTGALSAPGGVAVDASGSVYIADTGNNWVLKETLSKGSYTESTVASSGLNEPGGVAVDVSGNVYIADSGNNRIVKETPSAAAYIQSAIATSALNGPIGVAVDAAGNLYIADSGNNRVLMETLAGTSYTESTVASAGLSNPLGVAVDAGGNVYITDSGNNRVLKETLSGGVYAESTIAATSDPSNFTSYPWGVAVDANGNVYFDDSAGPGRVLKETAAAGSYTQSLLTSEAPSPVPNPTGLAVDVSGNNIYSAGDFHDLVVKLQTSTVDFGPVNVGSVAPPPITLLFQFDTEGTLGNTEVLSQGTPGIDFQCFGNCPNNSTYGTGPFYSSFDVIFDPQYPGVRLGAAVLLDASASHNILATASLTGTGVGPEVSFLPGGLETTEISGIPYAFGVAVDANDYVFSDDDTGSVYKTELGTLTRTNIASNLSVPAGIAEDGSGIVYVADTQYLYKFTPLNGSYAQSTIATVPDDLVGLAVDQYGNLYAAGAGTGNVYKWAPQGNGSYTQTLAGNAGVAATGVAVDGSGNVFVCNPNSGTLYAETLQPDGSYVQTVLAGGLSRPNSVAVDGGGNLYIAGSAPTEPYGGIVYKEALQSDGTYIQSSFAGPDDLWWVAVDGLGNLVLSQYAASSNVTLIAAEIASPLSFATTNVGSTSTDSPQTITLANIGNAPLAFPVPASGANPAITTSFSLDGSSTCPEISSSGNAGSLAAGSTCIYAVNFTPATAGSISGAMVLADTNLNTTGPPFGIQTIQLSGTGFTPYTSQTTVSVSPNPVTLGQAVTLTATVIDPTTSAPSPWGGSVTFTDTVAGVTVSLNGGAAVRLNDGTATLNVTPSIAGTHTITANYVDGCGCFASSTGQASLTVTTPSFELTSVSGSSGTAAPDGAAAYHLMLAPGSGPTYPDAVTFSATGLPPGATVAFSPATIPAGSGATPITMTIQTSKPQTARNEKPSLRGLLGPIALAFLLLPCTRVKRMWKAPGLPLVWAAALLSLGAMAGLSGCGTSGYGLTPKSYTVVAIATDAVTGAHSSVNVTLTVLIATAL